MRSLRPPLHPFGVPLPIAYGDREETGGAAGVESHEAAVRLFEGHPHGTIYPCDAVEVMPLLGG